MEEAKVEDNPVVEVKEEQKAEEKVEEQKPVEPSTPEDPKVEEKPAESPAPKPEEPKKEEPKPLTSIKDVGVAADRNARHRRTMEDEHVIVDNFMDDETCGYFAIYDGHGGKDAVTFVAKKLHENFADILRKTGDVKTAFNESYMLTDNQLGEAGIMFSGTTTISCFLRVEDGVKKLYTANVGDARAVLCRNNSGYRLSFDHKASDEEEIKRIQQAGGFVVMNRVNGVLAVARSLGDRTMKQYVSGEPFISETVLEPTDTHLILACDGVWDVLSDQDAVSLILKYETCKEAAKQLLIQSLRSGSTDNISVIVIKL